MAQEHLCSLYRGITSCGMRSQVEDGKRSVTSVHVYGADSEIEKSRQQDRHRFSCSAGWSSLVYV